MNALSSFFVAPEEASSLTSARPANLTDTGVARRANDVRVTLRRAAARDCELIWELCFCAELRASVLPPRMVLFKRYQLWFQDRLADRQTPVWIVEVSGASSGVMFIDRHDKQSLPRLTITLGARARSRGVGRKALVLLCEQWQRPVIAEVRSDNVACIRSLEAAGFGRANEREVGNYVQCTYLWSP
jgi:Acetyltransferase (GNAT) domain